VTSTAAPYHSLYVTIAVFVALDVLLIAVIASAKLLRERRDALRARIRASLADTLIAILEPDEESAGRTFTIASPRGLAGEATRETLVAFIATLRGEARERLIGICETRGYVRATAAQLRRRSALKRAEAASFLGGMLSREALPALADAYLNDPDAEVRIVAAEALSAFGDAPSIALLLRGLRDPTRYQELRLANALSRAGIAVIPSLEALLEDADERVVRLALDILIDIGTVCDTAAVLRALEHDSPEVRARAAELLGAAGAVDTVEQLVFASRDRTWFVRLRIVKALQRLGVPDRNPARHWYFQCLQHLLYDDFWHVRRNAAGVLAASGDEGTEILRVDRGEIAIAGLQMHRLRHGTHVPTVL